MPKWPGSSRPFRLWARSAAFPKFESYRAHPRDFAHAVRPSPTAWAKARTALINAVSRARRLCPPYNLGDSGHICARRVLRRDGGGVELGMPGAELVEPAHQRRELRAPVDLFSPIEIAEHAGRGEGADIEPGRVGRRLGERREAADDLAALVV